VCGLWLGAPVAISSHHPPFGSAPLLPRVMADTAPAPAVAPAVAPPGVALLAALAAAPHDTAALRAVRRAARKRGTDWTGAEAQAFALLRDASLPPAVRDTAYIVLDAALYAYHVRRRDRSVGAAPPASPLCALELDEWAVSVLLDAESRHRDCSTFLLYNSGNQPPSPRVAAAAAQALAAAAAAGREDPEALKVLRGLSKARNSAAVRALHEESCAAVAHTPGCLEALLVALPRAVDTAAGAESADFAAFEVVFAACTVPAGAQRCLALGAVERCTARLAASDDAVVAVLALQVLTALAAVGPPAWVCLCEAGTLAAALNAPTLRPWCYDMAINTCQLLDAAAEAAPQFEKKHFWVVLAPALATAPGAMAAFAAEDSDACRSLHGWLDHLYIDGGGVDDIARVALLNPCWPVAPLLYKPHSWEFDDEPDIHAELFEALDTDVCLATLSMPPRAARLAACVSAAVLAPRLPRLGMLLAAHAEQRASLLVGALLEHAITLAEDGSDATAVDEAAYRFKVLARAVGTLAEEAFPLTDRVADTRNSALPPRYTRADKPFDWRPDMQPALCQRPRYEGSDSEDESPDTTESRHVLFTRSDVNAPLRGAIAFLVGGETVHAVGCANTPLRRATARKSENDAAAASQGGNGARVARTARGDVRWRQRAAGARAAAAAARRHAPAAPRAFCGRGGAHVRALTRCATLD
jgi:hypothetical protein